MKKLMTIAIVGMFVLNAVPSTVSAMTEEEKTQKISIIMQMIATILEQIKLIEAGEVVNSIDSANDSTKVIETAGSSESSNESSEESAESDEVLEQAKELLKPVEIKTPDCVKFRYRCPAQA